MRIRTSSDLSPLRRLTTGPHGNRVTPVCLDPATVNTEPGIENLGRSVVRIRVIGCNDLIPTTGFIISNDGLVLATRHGLSFRKEEVRGPTLDILKSLEADSVHILARQLRSREEREQLPPENQYREVIADVIAISRDEDLALLQMRKAPEASLVISQTDPNPGEEVYMLGHPNFAPHHVVSWGEVMTHEQVSKRTAEFHPGSRFVPQEGTIYSNAHNDGGGSGAPLLDEHGRVVGMSRASYIDPKFDSATEDDRSRRLHQDYPSVCIAISSAPILSFLANAGISTESPPPRPSPIYRSNAINPTEIPEIREKLGRAGCRPFI